MRKIIDISRPGEEIEENIGRKKIVANKKQSKNLSKKKEISFDFFKKNNFAKIVIGITAVVIIWVLLWLGSGFYSKAVLEIKPKIEIKVYDEEIEVNINQVIADIQGKVIPGKFIEQSQEDSQTFQTEGKDIIEEKAQGIIRVFNSYNPPKSMAFRENTRFLSSEAGKIFKSLGKVSLTAAQLKDGKIIPSFKDIEVVAQEGGDDYNIGASKFSVPGLAGSPLYYSVWGESTSSMSGGLKAEITVIKKDDLEKAENSLKETLLKKAKESLRANLSEGFILGDDAIFVNSFEFSCAEKEGDKTAQFTCQGKISIKGLVFKMSEMKEIAMEKISKEVPAEKDFNKDNVVIEFFLKNLISDSGKGILSLKIGVGQYDKIPEEPIIFQAKGKTEKEINDVILNNFSQIESIKCGFWPIWVKKSPNDIKRITIEITP